MVGVRLTMRMRQQLEEIAKERGEPLAYLIREAVKEEYGL